MLDLYQIMWNPFDRYMVSRPEPIKSIFPQSVNGSGVCVVDSMGIHVFTKGLVGVSTYEPTLLHIPKKEIFFSVV